MFCYKINFITQSKWLNNQPFAATIDCKNNLKFTSAVCCVPFIRGDKSNYCNFLYELLYFNSLLIILISLWPYISKGLQKHWRYCYCFGLGKKTNVALSIIIKLIPINYNSWLNHTNFLTFFDIHQWPQFQRWTFKLCLEFFFYGILSCLPEL